MARRTNRRDDRDRKAGRSAKYKRARVRHFLFTNGPHRITRGRTTQRYLESDVTLREVEVVTDGWPEAFDGLRIGHVSDFHYGELMPAERAVEILDDLDGAEPDMFVCTGDVIDLHAEGAEPIFERMASMNAPLGSYLVLGNHDELHDRNDVERMARNAGVILLENECTDIIRNGERLLVAGVTWAKRQRDCAQLVNRTCADDEPVHVLLSHNPKAFAEAARLGIPLTLSGHTHGGQVALKQRPGANLSLTHRRSAGLYEKNGSHLFVTTGVGAWFPLRVNCPAEVAVLTMRSASSHSDA